MQIGDQEERISRSITAPVDEPNSSDFTLPNKTTRSGKVLGFNSTGNPEAVSSSISSASVSNTTTGSAGSSAYQLQQPLTPEQVM